MKSKFIVFEGIDHTGKTTQLDMIEGWMRLRNIDFERYREPGGTDTGEKIRELLLDKTRVEMFPVTEILLFFSSRAQLVEEKIQPALKAGRNVILDRYWFSTAAYQGPWMKNGVYRILELARLFELPRPDLVICLDGDPKILANRKRGPSDRIEAKGIEYQKKVRQAYQDLSVQYAPQFRMVDAARGAEKIHEEIIGLLENLP